MPDNEVEKRFSLRPKHPARFFRQAAKSGKLLKSRAILLLVCQRIPYLAALLFLSCLVYTCQYDPTQPEDVVRSYVAALAANDFAQAAQLSTPRHTAYLEALAVVIGDDLPTADSAWIEIESLVCEARQDRVYCATVERDPYETSEKEYWLVQLGKRWFVDRPPEDAQLEHREELQ